MRRDRILRSRPLRLSVLLGGLLLGGCGMMPGAAPTPADGAAPAPPSDPVVAFAATNQVGAQASLPLAGGRTPVRVTRSYYAASGRECREVLVGAGAGARSQLVCQAEGGAWVAARPLLRGGSLRQ
jgi:hypothetical protein